MPKIGTTEEIAAKYARVTPGRSTDYANGVKNPKVDWKTATANAQDSYAQGVQDAIGRGAFAKGVNKAGTAKWQDKAVNLGTTRWGAGVTAAQGDYATGFAPYQAVISGTDLPPRGPKGDPRNFDRVVRLGTALHAKKLSG